MSARFGPRSITIGAGLDIIGTIALIVTGVRYGGHLTAWDLGRLGSVPSRGSAVSAMVLAMAVETAIVLGATGLTFVLPRRPASPAVAVTQDHAAEFTAGAAH